MKHFFKIGFLSTIIFLLSACSVKKEEAIEVQFFEDKINQAEVLSKVDTCSMIQSINQKEFVYIPQNKSKDHEYIFEENSIVCEEVNLDTLGVKEISYIVNGKRMNATLQVIDSIAPVIEVEDIYVIEKGNIYFDLNKIIKAKDNFDVEIKTGFVGSLDVNQPGEYPLKVIAKDLSGNQSEKAIKVKVVDSLAEKEKELEQLKNQKQESTVVEKKVIQYITAPSNSTSTPDTKPKSQPVLNQNVRKKFYASQYQFNTTQTFNACTQHMENSSTGGTCTPFKNSSGNWDGYEFIP